MMGSIGRSLVVPAVAFALLAASASLARAAGTSDPDWPCVQRRVPEITAGIVWTGPEIDEKADAWRKDPAVKDLVAQLSERRMTLEQAREEVDRFAADLGEDRTAKLTLLFTGLLQVINAERREIMAGIERYSRRQYALADRINELRHELDGLLEKDALSDEERQRRDTLEERMSWETRIFDERRQSLTFVCESPVLLEQRLFALGRAILAHVE